MHFQIAVDIPIPKKLSTALERKRKESKSEFVVPAEKTGTEMSQSAFKRMWGIVVGYTGKVVKRDKNGKTVKDERGKPVKVKKKHPGVVSFHVEPHQLRHTYITELCASGMDIKKIQYLAGHKTVQMTLNIYTQVTQNKPEQLAPAIIATFDV